MKKRIFLAGWFWALSGFSHFAHSGFYSELNLGANFVKTSKFLTFPLNDPPVSQVNFDSSYNNLHGQLALGYDLPLSNYWNLALEGNLDLFTGTARYSYSNWFANTPAYASERFNYGLGLFVLPSYTLHSNVKLFAGPGIMWADYRIDSNLAATGGNLGYTGNFNHGLTGFGIKAGTAITLTSSLDLLLTYQFTGYQKTSLTSIEPLTEQAIHSSYRPFVNFVLLGLKYQFNPRIPSSLWKK